MAYAGIDNWRASYSPMLRALQGDEDPIGFDEDWDEDGILDPWSSFKTEQREGGTVEVERPEMAPKAPSNAVGFDIVFPDERDEGRRRADRTAASRGVNPGRQGGGTGHLFDLAKSFLGTPYVFGAGGPTAFDCSGFVQYLFKRVYGVDLPHNAAMQSSHTKKVSREQLQPGDLIFYSYGRLGKGAIDHVEVYMGGGKQIGTSNPTDDLDIDGVDWDNVVVFGRVPGAAVAQSGRGEVDPKLGSPKVVTKRTPVMKDQASAPAMLTGEYGDASFATVLGEVLAGDTMNTVRKVKTPQFRGPDAGIKRQLYRGFIDAGRPDLARMVGTKDFATWIQQESGWQVGVTSPANNHGKANDGLFQVWRGHDFNDRGQVSRMSPYEQAQLVAQYFSHLTPEAIREYAAAIRAGTYGGWG